MTNFNRNRMFVGNSIAIVAAAMLAQVRDGRAGLVSDAYELGSLKPQQITHGPQRKGTRGKILRW